MKRKRLEIKKEKKAIIYTIDALLAITFALIMFLGASNYQQRTSFNQFVIAQPYETGADLLIILHEAGVIEQFYEENRWIRIGTVRDQAVDEEYELQGNTAFVTQTTDSYDYYLSFGGAGDYVVVNDSERFDIENVDDFSVSFFVRTNQAQSGYIWAMDSTRKFFINIEESCGGCLRVYLEDDGGSYYEWLTDDSINNSAWHHIVVTWAGVGNVMNVYLNGTSASSSSSSSGSIGALTFEDDLYLGQNASSASYFSGEINQLRMYDEVISSFDIETLSQENEIAPEPILEIDADIEIDTINDEINKVKATQYSARISLLTDRNTTIATREEPNSSTATTFIGSMTGLLALTDQNQTDLVEISYEMWIE